MRVLKRARARPCASQPPHPLNVLHSLPSQQTLVMGPGAKLVGTDSNGNKYYERMTEQYGE